ncbi:MAG TPA: Zn-ribbon domain-containing OB-fold protein [Myxococcota bacterium]|nr:Zn-ribbon domain-containing OB-fold protein [Myxococcota bacterium]
MTEKRTIDKPLPRATPTSRPFWDGLRAGEIRIQRCTHCATWIFYPRSHCPHCLAREPEWVVVDGHARLHTFTVAHAPTAPFFADETPQLLAVVELEQGVRITTTLVDVEVPQIRIGMRVRPVFEPTDGGEGVLLRYAPDEGAS